MALASAWMEKRGYPIINATAIMIPNVNHDLLFLMIGLPSSFSFPGRPPGTWMFAAERTLSFQPPGRHKGEQAILELRFEIPAGYIGCPLRRIRQIFPCDQNLLQERLLTGCNPDLEADIAPVEGEMMGRNTVNIVYALITTVAYSGRNMLAELGAGHVGQGYREIMFTLCRIEGAFDIAGHFLGGIYVVSPVVKREGLAVIYELLVYQVSLALDPESVGRRT